MVVMDSSVKYRSDFEQYPIKQVFYNRSRPGSIQQRFVVPWQMEDMEGKKEKGSSQGRD